MLGQPTETLEISSGVTDGNMFNASGPYAHAAEYTACDSTLHYRIIPEFTAKLSKRLLSLWPKKSALRNCHQQRPLICQFSVSN